MENPKPPKNYIPLNEYEFRGIINGEQSAIEDGFSMGYLEHDKLTGTWILSGIKIFDNINLTNIKITFANFEIKESNLNYLELNKISAKNLTFSDTILDELIIKDSNIENLNFENKTSIKNIKINDCRPLGNIKFDNCSINDKIEIVESKFKDLIFRADSNVQFIKIHQTNITRQTIEQSKIGGLQIENSTIDYFQASVNSHVGFLGGKPSEDLWNSYIKDSNFYTFTLEDSTNFNVLKLNSVKILVGLELNLKSNIDFFFIENNSEIEKLILKDSTLTEAYISNVKINNINILELSHIGFFNTSGEIGNFYSNNSSIERLYISSIKKITVTYENNSNISECSISNIENLNFSVHYSTVYKLNLSKVVINNLKFLNSEIAEALCRFPQDEEKSEIKYLFINSTFIYKLHLPDFAINNLHIEASTIVQIYLDKNQIKRKFQILRKSKIWHLIIEGKEVKKILLEDSYIQNLEWKQDTLCMLSVDKCEIETFLFKHTAIPKDSVFQISDTHVNQFIFSQFVNTAWLNISNLQPLKKYSRFKLESSESEIQKIPEYSIEESKQFFLFEKVEKKSSIRLLNSDMGKTSFVDCKLNEFDEFVYYNTKMLETYVGGTRMPSKVKIPSNVNQTEEKEQKRLAYAQFKKIYENRGDNVSATEFLALELDTYAEELEKDKIKPGERFNLWLNKFSSNHGNDWIRAAIVTISINSFLFLWYCMILGHCLGDNWGLFFKLCAYSLEFLNPLRKAGFLEPAYELSEGREGLLILWDYASRIIIAYFVYQTIQAFRRFGKTK